jgi:hypothetical protein
MFLRKRLEQRWQPSFLRVDGRADSPCDLAHQSVELRQALIAQTEPSREPAPRTCSFLDRAHVGGSRRRVGRLDDDHLRTLSGDEVCQLLLGEKSPRFHAHLVEIEH